MKTIDVLGVGTVSVDLVGTTRAWPEQGCKQELAGMGLYDGGLVGTALAAVTRLGGRAAYSGKLGNSDFAKRALMGLERDQIDISMMIPCPDADPIVAFVIANTLNGERTIFWSRANVQYPDVSELPQNWCDRIKVLMIDFDTGQCGIGIAQAARAKSIPVVIDVEGLTPYTKELLAASGFIIVSEDFGKTYSGSSNAAKMFSALRTSADQTVIITRGAKGCIGNGPAGIFELGAYHVQVVDTTGCGDTFHGAFALGLARRLNTLDAARFASAAAALCATRLGGRDGIPALADVTKLMQSQSI